MIRAMVPYLVGLAIAAALFVYMGHLDYTARPGQLGPATWPRLVIGLMAAACLLEIARVAIGGKAAPRGIAAPLEEAGETESEPARFPALVAGGIALVGLYAVLVPVLGFLLATFLFIAAFMYLGRYRRHGAVWAISTAVTVLVGILFLRIAYVSLPRGVPPFDRITDVFFLIPGR
jgi:putative tricarboxylic transport membrane protein